MLGYLRALRVREPEDVLGEVFVSVARDIRRFSGDDDALRRWVFSIAHNRAMDAHRRDKRKPPPTLEEALADRLPDEVPPPADPFDPVLVDALSTLSPDQREVLVLRFVADLPLEAVAAMTKRTVGAVKALQHRGLGNLAKAVSREA